MGRAVDIQFPRFKYINEIEILIHFEKFDENLKKLFKHIILRKSMNKIFLIMALVVCSISNSYSEANQMQPLSSNLRGEIHYSWFFFDVYHAKLWAENNKAIYTVPFTLELIYKRDFTGNDITDRSISELLEQGEKKELLDKWDKKMRSIFPDVKEGDIILANYKPDEGLKFYLNGKKDLGEISDKSFSIVFMNIWLGKKSSDQEMRSKLLGEKK